MVMCDYLINKFGDINIHAGNFTPINIHANGKIAFQRSCFNGHLEIVKWLIDLCLQKNFTVVNIHTNNDLAFRWSCENGYLEVAK